MLTSFNEWYIYMYVCNWAAQKQSRSQTDLSITHLHQHIWSIHNSYTCPKCAYKILQIFSRVFEFALAEFARNTRKLMYREYFHFYSICLKRKKILHKIRGNAENWVSIFSNDRNSSISFVWHVIFMLVSYFKHNSTLPKTFLEQLIGKCMSYKILVVIRIKFDTINSCDNVKICDLYKK